MYCCQLVGLVSLERNVISAVTYEIINRQILISALMKIMNRPKLDEKKKYLLNLNCFYRDVPVPIEL